MSPRMVLFLLTCSFLSMAITAATLYLQLSAIAEVH